MKNLKPFIISAMILTGFMTSSCEVVGGIFKAGMGVGIFLVVLVIVVIVAIVMRAGKK